MTNISGRGTRPGAPDTVRRHHRDSTARSRSRRAKVLLGGLLAGVTMAGTACGSSSSPGASSTASAGTGSQGASVSARFASQLPASIRSAGVLSDVSAFNYPPYDYTSSAGAYVGGEVAILNEAAALLGVKMQYQRLTEFSALIPAVADGRVNMAGESVGITAPRRQQVAFVEYGITGEGLLVKQGNPSGISVTNVCGHSVSVESGAVEVPFYQDLSKQCVAQGKKPIAVDVFANEPAQVLAVEDGHADAVGVGSTTTASIAKTSNGALVDLPGLVPGGALPLGFIVNRNETALGKALTSAFSYLLSTGELARINKQYNLVTTLKVQFLPAT
jgi:polar amino acid transport system substrate-binding protein